MTQVLKILHDNSGEVQNLAVKCIAKLLQRSLAQQREKNADRIGDTLCNDLVSSGKEERQRDIASLALKSCVGVIGQQACGESLIITLQENIFSRSILFKPFKLRRLLVEC